MNCQPLPLFPTRLNIFQQSWLGTPTQRPAAANIWQTISTDSTYSTCPIDPTGFLTQTSFQFVLQPSLNVISLFESWYLSWVLQMSSDNIIKMPLLVNPLSVKAKSKTLNKCRCESREDLDRGSGESLIVQKITAAAKWWHRCCCFNSFHLQCTISSSPPPQKSTSFAQTVPSV